MHIGQKPIGNGASPYIIAEIGVNHDGSLSRALELVRLAADAGADAVKLQYFEPRRLMSGHARLAEYQAARGASDPIKMLESLYLDLESMARVVEETHAHGLHAIVTLFSIETVEPAAALRWDAFKTASPDVINRPLLEELAKCLRPLILSTGAATVIEVLRTVGWMSNVRDRLAFMQCVSAYPTPDEHAALAGIRALRMATEVPVGYSDHTSPVDTGGLAVAAGAALLEKHLTYDSSARGPDHAASLEPESFHQYVQLARRSHRMLGVQHKHVLDIEQDVRRASRQSIVAAQDISRGQTITRAMLTVKRPGDGIEPWRLEEVIGRVATRTVSADSFIQARDLSEAPVEAAAL